MGSATQHCRRRLMLSPKLVQLLSQLNSEVDSPVFISANAFAMYMDFVTDPQAYGFVTSKVACCGQGPYNGIGLCTPAWNLCPNRDIFAFWDPFHPSERANRLIVERFMTGSTQYMNLSTILLWILGPSFIIAFIYFLSIIYPSLYFYIVFLH